MTEELWREEIEKCKNNPYYFCKTYLKTFKTFLSEEEFNSYYYKTIDYDVVDNYTRGKGNHYKYAIYLKGNILFEYSIYWHPDCVKIATSIDLDKDFNFKEVLLKFHNEKDLIKENILGYGEGEKDFTING